MDAKLDRAPARSDRAASGEQRAERALVLAAKADRAQRDRLVETFLPLIGSVARLYRNTPGVEREELMQEGVVGLLRALERYDPAFGTPFWAYASSWVRQAMQQLVAELSGPVVLSSRAMRKLAHLRECRRERAQATRREPTTTDLVEQTALSHDEIEHLLAAYRTTRSIEQPVQTGDDDSWTLRDLLVDERAEDAFDRVLTNVTAQALPTLLTTLTARELMVVTNRMGLDGDACTLREIGARLEVSPERVRQIEEATLQKLHALAAGPEDAADAARGLQAPATPFGC
jgi:RNA polymerase primary sigma factor